MTRHTWAITRLTAHATDDGKPVNSPLTAEQKKDLVHKFRLKDDGNIYAYGYCRTNDDELAFSPLDHYGEGMFGCVCIEYWNVEKKQWEVL